MQSDSNPSTDASAVGSKLRDGTASYGWISIALHWLAAALVLIIWFIGSSITTSGQRAEQKLHLHTTLAACAYLFLWLRIGWRFRTGMPKALPAQRGWAFSVGKIVHWLLLGAIAVMLLSGPLVAWLRGDAIHILSLSIPSPFSMHPEAATLIREIHGWGASIILMGTLLHIGGAIKHAAINGDGTFERILVAGEPKPPVKRDN